MRNAVNKELCRLKCVTWGLLIVQVELCHLTKMTQVISLDEVGQVAKNMLENKTFGRIVVDVNL